MDTYYCVNGVIQEDRACICLEKAEHACIEIVQECELPTVQCGILRIEKQFKKMENYGNPAMMRALR